MPKIRIYVKRNYLREKKGAGKKMTILAGEMIWEVGEDPRDQRTAWRQDMGNAQGGITIRSSNYEQHSTNRYNFPPSLPRPTENVVLGKIMPWAAE